jgi:iron complex outermembrane receptor protein
LNAAENPLIEGQTIGERDIFEIFGEINLPLFESLQLDAALRYTDEENFGSETTWRTRIIWQALDYLTLSGSIGTSYRAPNLREQFLADQGGGVAGSADICRRGAIDEAILFVGQDDPDLQFLLNNCVAQGVTIIDSDGDGNLDTGFIGSNVTIPTSAGGNSELKAETSESQTATILFRQPWFDGFDFEIAASYWAIVVENTVEELDVGAILGRCYSDTDFPNGTSPFCDRHTRRVLADGTSGAIIGTGDRVYRA